MKISADGNTVIIRIPNNFHVHLRQGMLLKFIVNILINCGWRGLIVIEPNPDPPIRTGIEAMGYKEQIIEAFPSGQRKSGFKAVMTVQMTEDTTRKMVTDDHDIGVKIYKVYPRYVTNNSEHGVVDYEKIYPALEVCEEFDKVVQFHAEHPSYEVIGRHKEARFIKILDKIRKHFPKLRISVEHVSSKEMVCWVKSQQLLNVGASVTVHHIYQTSDDLNGYSKRSGGRICVDDGGFKPGAKDPDDRDAIRDAILSGDPKFWYGGDDALHPKSRKHCSRSCCGAWNTIAALPLLISFFLKNGAAKKFEPFMCDHGTAFYGLKEVEKDECALTFVREDWQVPMEMEIPGTGEIATPFYAGETMEWRLVD